MSRPKLLIENFSPRPCSIVPYFRLSPDPDQPLPRLFQNLRAQTPQNPRPNTPKTPKSPTPKQDPSPRTMCTHRRHSQPPQLETIDRHAETVQHSTIFPRGIPVRLGEFSADDLFLQRSPLVGLRSSIRSGGKVEVGGGNTSRALR